MAATLSVDLPLTATAVRADLTVAIRRPATVFAVAARGTSVQLAPPPPLDYPSGVCDSLAPGLTGLAGPRPEQARQIGTSVSGRPIWAEYWGPASPASIAVVVGQVHGNECSPTLITHEIRANPPARTGVWLIPTLNPDGYATYNRRNANQVDLNADGGVRSQPETVALMSFVEQLRPALVVHVHSPNGFAGAYSPSGGQRAATLCWAIAENTPIRCSGGGAGTRTDVSRWFLWQGHARYGGESLLVEFHAVAESEVPTALPRPPTRNVEQVRADVRQVIALLDL